MSTRYSDNENISLWRLAMITTARTVLAFALPYFAAYYSVIGAWRGIHVLMLWIHSTS